MTRIVTRAPSPADAAALVRHGVHPVIARLYASRGVCSPEEIETELKKLHAPVGLKGCDEAAAVLADALAAKRRMLVVADYDCGGAIAIVVMRRCRARLADVRRADRLPGAEPVRIRLWPDA